MEVRGEGHYLTHVRATSAHTLDKLVVREKGELWPAQTPTFGLHLGCSGEPEFDDRYEVYREGEASVRHWDGATSVLAIGQAPRLGCVREIAVGGNTATIMLGADPPADSLLRAIRFAVDLAR